MSGYGSDPKYPTVSNYEEQRRAQIQATIARPKCPRCAKFYEDHPWDGERERHTGTQLGSPVDCAFDADGKFKSANWCCLTMAILREQDEDDQRSIWWSDHRAMLLAVDPPGGREDWGAVQFGALVLQWYKHRGRTESAFVIYEAEAAPLTLATAEFLCAELRA
jgi:hypothetical protein